MAHRIRDAEPAYIIEDLARWDLMDSPDLERQPDVFVISPDDSRQQPEEASLREALAELGLTDLALGDGDDSRGGSG